MKFGVFLPFYTFKNETNAESIFANLKNTVLECEKIGYDSVWIDDHLMYGKSPILECWTTLSALASATKKIRLGTMVTSNAFRNPGLLAKMAATIDVISGGRLDMGIGAGVQREEHDAYGFSFPKPKSRISKLEETVEILKQMWTKEKVTFVGKFYTILNASCEPKPVQKPYPPITIGGCGEKYTLKVTAKYANRFDFGYLPSIDLYKHKLQVLRQYCRKVGRSFDVIEKSCWVSGEQLIRPRKMESECDETSVQNLKCHADLGVTQCMVFFSDLPNATNLRLLLQIVKKIFSQ
jgi:F420-dependent oxidoreductase-like protein